MKNPRFVSISFDPQTLNIREFQLIKEISDLLYRYRTRLFDDFAYCECADPVEKTLQLVREYSPAFWAILDPKNGELAGVVYLYDWRGNRSFNFSACVSTCFKRKYWGAFARRAGRLFLRHVCHKYRLLSLRAEVFDNNPCGGAFLRRLGFVCCGVNKYVTMSREKLVSISNYVYCPAQTAAQRRECESSVIKS